MATPSRNRYAIFASEDDKAAAAPNPPPDPAKNPFLNQVGDDSIPWEEVKKRNTSAVAASASRTVDTTNTRTESALMQNAAEKEDSTTSQSTAKGTNKSPLSPREYWCGVCSIQLPSKVALLSHIKLFANHKHYCNLCKRVFKDRNGLKNHVDRALGHENFCNLCLSAFKDHWALKNHFETKYRVGHDFVCLTCLVGFQTHTEMETHLLTADKHTWCQPCQRRFRNQHERDEHWLTTNRHKHCLEPGCDFDGPDQAALAEHLKQDHFQCQECKTIFPSMNKLHQHFSGCQSAPACPHCGEKCAGKGQLENHMKHCFLCEECGYHTQHEGNFEIHMTKHSPANLVCWCCDAPMRKYSSLINHLESGHCAKLQDLGPFMRCLGNWWYSPLYMDLDVHAQIRTGRVDVYELWKWMGEGVLHPFVCRATGCGKTFTHLSSLLLHCESKACEWDVDRLNMPGLEKEYKRFCAEDK